MFLFGGAALRLAALAALVLGLLGGGPPQQDVRRPYLGMAYGNTLLDSSDAELGEALDDAVDLGFTTVRVDLGWNDVQPASPDRYEWTRTDRVVRAAQQRSLGLIMTVAYAPDWARIPGCTEVTCPPARPESIAPFATAAAQRYRTSGVVAWEIWNEQNTTGFWGPRVDPAAYTRLLVTAADAIHAADPGSTVLVGGLACVPTADGNLSQSDFLDRVGDLGGLRVVDGVAFHPYTYPSLPTESLAAGGPWSKIDQSADSLKAVLGRHGAGSLPIWLTEFGAPTGGPGASSDSAEEDGADVTHVTEAQQARIATDAVTTVVADPSIAAMMWYSDRDLGDDNSINLNSYGLRRADKAAKPAFDALRRAVGTFARA